MAAAQQIEHIHNRMPVILKGDALADWMSMDTDKAKALELLQESRGTDLVYHTVSKDVGSVKNKDSYLIDEVAA